MKETVMEKIMQLKTIKEYNDYMGVETRHPLVSVIEEAVCRTPYPMHASTWGCMWSSWKNYGVRTIWPILTLLRFSREYVGVYRSGASVRTWSRRNDFYRFGLVSAVPSRLAAGHTALPPYAGLYFFSYAANEALHLSKQEQQTVIDCLTKIDEETYDKADRHSNLIIASAIELLLNYCIRFYDRQFITRKKRTRIHSVLSKPCWMTISFRINPLNSVHQPLLIVLTSCICLRIISEIWLKKRPVYLHKNIYWQKQWIQQKSCLPILQNLSVMWLML